MKDILMWGALAVLIFWGLSMIGLWLKLAPVALGGA